MTSEARRLLQSLRRHHSSAPAKAISFDEHLAAAEAAAVAAECVSDDPEADAGPSTGHPSNGVAE
jgi:hypothetical protein